MRASAVDRRLTEDAGGGPSFVAGRRRDLGRVHVHRLDGTLILVLLLPLHSLVGEDPGVATEVGAVHVVGDDPTAVRDLHLAQSRAHGRRPRLFGVARRLRWLLHPVAVRVGEGMDSVYAWQ